MMQPRGIRSFERLLDLLLCLVKFPCLDQRQGQIACDGYIARNAYAQANQRALSRHFSPRL